MVTGDFGAVGDWRKKRKLKINNAVQGNSSRDMGAARKANKPKRAMIDPDRQRKSETARVRSGQEVQERRQNPVEQPINEAMFNHPGMMGGMDENFLNDLLSNEYLIPRSAEDIIGPARQGMDQELERLLAALGQVEGSARDNYKTSNQNLGNMYSAHEEDIRTNSMQDQRDITAGSLGQTNSAEKEALQRLSQTQAADNSSETAMLNSLGISAAGAQPDDYNPLAEAQGDISRGSSSSRDRINEIGAANLSATGRFADTVGLEGKGAQSDLQGQLDALLGELGMQEAQYQNQHSDRLRELLMQGNELANNERQQYGQFQAEIGQGLMGGMMDQQMAQIEGQNDAANSQLEFEREMQALDREQEWRYRTEQEKGRGSLERAQLNQDRGSNFDPIQEAFKSMLSNGKQTPQEALEWLRGAYG